MTKSNTSRSPDQLDNTIKQQQAEINSLVSKYNLLLKVISHTPGNVFWKDLDGNYMGCNKNIAELYGFNNPEDIIGKKNIDVITHMLIAQNAHPSPDHQQEKKLGAQFARVADEQDESVVYSGKESTIEEKGLNKDLQDTLYLSKKIPLKINGQIKGLVGISFDISDRKEMEDDLRKAKEEAERASDLKSEFVANMSHDIKTPLASIIGIAELLTRRLDDKELDFAKALLASSQNLLKFFDNCLEAFKLEGQNLQLPKSSFNVSTLTNEIYETFQPLVSKKHLKLILHNTLESEAIIHSSQIAIHRILLNLINNAVKFTDKGSVTISISSQIIEQQTYLRISVEDTGPGIPKNKQQYIFERFTKLIPSYKGIYDGSGIGLYVVEKLTHSLEGKIELKSQVGRGSCFTVSIPIETGKHLKDETKPLVNKLAISEPPDNLEDELSKKIPSSNPVENGKAHILIVEDNAIVQRIQQSLLNELNYSVDLASSGEEALQMFEPGKYNIILMDIGLPGLQGDVTSTLIRKMEKANSDKRIPIIALTAHSTDSMVKSFKKAGINDVINKPLSQETIHQMIEKHLG